MKEVKLPSRSLKRPMTQPKYPGQSLKRLLPQPKVGVTALSTALICALIFLAVCHVHPQPQRQQPGTAPRHGYGNSQDPTSRFTKHQPPTWSPAMHPPQRVHKMLLASSGMHSDSQPQRLPQAHQPYPKSEAWNPHSKMSLIRQQLRRRQTYSERESLIRPLLSTPSQASRRRCHLPHHQKSFTRAQYLARSQYNMTFAQWTWRR